MEKAMASSRAFLRWMAGPSSASRFEVLKPLDGRSLTHSAVLIPMSKISIEKG